MRERKKENECGAKSTTLTWSGFFFFFKECKLENGIDESREKASRENC